MNNSPLHPYRFFLLLLILTSTLYRQVGAQDLSAVFKGKRSAFVLYDMNQNRFVRYNEQRCAQRMSPFSTFKIPNTLIGLETGVVTDSSSRIPWDSTKYPLESSGNAAWRGDQTLRTAIKYSVVWYYMEVALRVGEKRMKEFVSAFHYGNEDISSGMPDPKRGECFWLDGSLRISADEQVEFLKKFYAGNLPVSKRSINITKSILVQERTPDYTLSGKTGGGPGANGATLGWFVGYLVTKSNVCIFAMDVDGPDFESIRATRIALTKQALTALGYLPSH